MNTNQRFSILTFPQYYDGTTLSINIVVLPRNQNPFLPAIEPSLLTSGELAAAFVDAKLQFKAAYFDTLQTSPHLQPPFTDALTVKVPQNKKKIFQTLGESFSILDKNITNSSSSLDNLHKDRKPPEAKPVELTVKKYLPHSYRNSFNFSTPRHQNAVTDDSYHCAIKGAEYVKNFKNSPDSVSWGKVFAYLMRQPLLAEEAGLLYRTTMKIPHGTFHKGGWLYIDLAGRSDYLREVNADQSFIRRYASRIPPLEGVEKRHVFAALQFPVLDNPSSDLGSSYDQLFIEAAEYDDGFAKIVHCRQPVNRDMLVEENDGAHPVKDTGIQLGWDDEQILIWYIRQMENAPATGLSLNGRLDAPLGVFGYNIDVRESGESENKWESLNSVETKMPLTLPPPLGGRRPIVVGNFLGELGYQVYPAQVDGRKEKNFWLPMYFAGWNGHSMVLPDQEAASIYRTTSSELEGDPYNSTLGTGTGVTGPAQNLLNKMYEGGKISTALRYGGVYDFRVRLQDLSGGSPDVEASSINKTTLDYATCRFKRYLSPNQPRVLELLPSIEGNKGLVNSDQIGGYNELNIKRPKLGYPAVVFTGKYKDPVQRLIDQAESGLQPFDDNNPYTEDAQHREGLGIADPDVDRIEIVVEIGSLNLDKVDSISGKDDYVHLYTTERTFSVTPVVDDDEYESTLKLPIEYRDVKVLHTGNDKDLVDDLDLSDSIDNLPGLVLPTGRTLRLTIRALCAGDDQNYYGFILDDDKKLDNRFGEPIQVLLSSPSVDERELLTKTARVPELQAIYMQPDLVTNYDGRVVTALLGRPVTSQHSNIKKLADRLQLESSGLTLGGDKGQRVVFGCSSRVRHTLSPDHSSITFSSKGDLFNHWLCCLSFDINRDWMWDGLEYGSFIIKRTKRFTSDTDPIESDVVVGEIEVIRTASFEALHYPQRNNTRIVFIDAVEPKKVQVDDEEKEFPDSIELSYTIETRLKPGYGELHDEVEVQDVTLPITTTPSQTPKIVSAGIALSPYVRDNEYASSEPRSKHLWIEFEEKVKDPQDCYYARMLAVAPDQLISNNNIVLLEAPDEPELPIDPEYIRVVTQDSGNDLAGISAMQRMEKSSSSDTHYLLPLPPGLHANADEMFGFFTYEFCVGHYKKVTDKDEMVWCTAQGRFGRRLRVTGIQHPAPILTCSPNRDEDKLWVTAPYAVAVHEGKNVSADPPRTELWALLYTQVKQADNLDYRNILLDDRYLDWRIKVETKKKQKRLVDYNEIDRKVLKSISGKIFKYELDSTIERSGLRLKKIVKNEGATKYGTTIWMNSEIAQILSTYGLPQNSKLSVLVVETLPQITNVFEHVSNLSKKGADISVAKMMDNDQQERFIREMDSQSEVSMQSMVMVKPSPVNEELGHHRLLRTSPLTKVPDVCV